MQFFLQVADQVVAFRLRVLLGVEALCQFVADLRSQLAVVGFVEFWRGYFALGLACFCFQVVDGGADLFYFSVGEFNRVHDCLFFYFFGTRLDHHDPVGGADDHDVQEAVAHFAVGRINDELAANQAYANSSDGAVERNVRDRQSRRGAVDPGYVGIIFRVRRKHKRDDLRLALKSFREQRPDGPINLPAGQNLAFAGTAFTLDEAAGNASASVSVFPIIDSEGEEIDAFARVGIGHGGGQNDAFSDAHHDRAVGLFG